jgi:UDP-glucose 4-epimerase
MNILITGAGGFIGSHLVEKYREEGHFVVGIDRKDPYCWSRGKAVCDLEFYLDVRSIFELPERCTFLENPQNLGGGTGNFSPHFDLCFHLAADARIQPSFATPVEYVANNVMGTVEVLNFCKQRGTRLIYAGSSTADDDVSKNVYATTKFTGEMLCKTWSRCFGLSTAVARFYNVYGSRQVEEGRDATVIGIWEKQLREGKKITITGDGHKRRDFTAVEDIVDGLFAIAERGGDHGQVYGLGTGKNYGILEAAKMFVPMDRIEFIQDRPGESEETLADVAYTAKTIGWKAIRSLEDYAKEKLQCS